MFPEKRLRDLYRMVKGGYTKLEKKAMKEFGWTSGQTYIATEFLYRPKENYN